MSSPSWLSYVPYNIAADILDRAGADPVGREQHRQAVAMFADVSGFTAISEALAQAGRAGTEELTRILNDYFETMIALVRDYGGIVGQFGGDALAVLFPYTPPTQADTALRAIQCGLAMQHAMDRYSSIQTQVGRFQLSFKAGLAAGGFYSTTVGSLDVGLKSVVCGSAMDLCCDAEKAAARGEVVIHDSLLGALGGTHALTLHAKTPGFYHVLRLDDPPAPQSLPPLERDLNADEEHTLAAYLHPVIAERLTRGQQGFVSEHRSVTVLFVNFTSFDYDHDPGVGAKLQDYLSGVLRIVQRYGGYLNKVDMGDKGSKVIVLFGAPVAYEEDDERALHCALELRSLPGAEVRIGINTGLAFCGLVGAAARQEYTVIGDTVNLAARLMQAARMGQILVSHDTQRRAAPTFSWTHLDPISVKGKAEPVQVYTVDRVRGRSIMQAQELEYALPMVGREGELARAFEAIARVQAAHGQIIGITADAGMGKTRLSAEIIRQALAQGLKGYGSACESYGTTTSYLVWHQIWRAFFDIDPAWPRATVERLLETQLAQIDPALVRRMPLLGAALNITLPDNDLTAGLDARLRKASLEALLVACVRARAVAGPLLLVLEDTHWIDPLSFDLLDAIARNIVDVPVLLVLVYRPPELAHIDLSEIRRAPHFAELVLSEFTHAEAETLIRLKLARLFADQDAAAPEFIRQITARAQGNPFYIDEMINLLQDQGIDLHDPVALQSVELPDSLHSLIISRIDRLLEDQQITLKVASVIGRLFRADWLWHVYPDMGDPQRVQHQLDALRSGDFLLASGAVSGTDAGAVPRDPALEYLFKHVVTQEVAYSSLAVATRARLHEQVAAFIEQTYPDTLDRYLDLLAYHYGHSDNIAKQRVYFHRAGDAAAAAYANDAALDYYQRLIPLLAVEEQPACLLKLGKVWELTGKWDEAEATYRRALALAEQHAGSTQQAQARNELGRLLTSRGTFDEALVLLQQAREQFAQVDDQQGVGRVLRNTGNVYLHQGDAAQAGAYFERALAVAQAAGDRELEAGAWGSWGMARYFQGDVDQALRYTERQAELRTALGDKHGAAISRNNIGVMHENRGDTVRAMDSYRHLLAVAVEVGDRPRVGVAVGNLGILYRAPGDYDRALQCFVCQLEIGLEVGDLRVISFALSDMAEVHKQQGHAAIAERLGADAITLARALNLRLELNRYLHRQAVFCADQERYADAQALNDEALLIAQETGRRDVEFSARLLAVCIRYGRTRDTAAAIRDLEALLADWDEDKQQAALHYELWRLDPARAASRERAAAIYRDLYAQTATIDYHTRYRELTGSSLPELPALPPLPDAVAQCTPDRAALLDRVEALIAAL